MSTLVPSSPRWHTLFCPFQQQEGMVVVARIYNVYFYNSTRIIVFHHFQCQKSRSCSLLYRFQPLLSYPIMSTSAIGKTHNRGEQFHREIHHQHSTAVLNSTRESWHLRPRSALTDTHSQSTAKHYSLLSNPTTVNRYPLYCQPLPRYSQPPETSLR